MSKAQADYDAFVNEYFKRGALRTMNQDERAAILGGEWPVRAQSVLIRLDPEF